MGGPTAALLLRRKLTQTQLDQVKADLRKVSKDFVKDDNWDWRFWVNHTASIRGNYRGESRPFGFFIKDTQEADWEFGGLSQFNAYFGFEPEQTMQFDAMCNSTEDRRILGELLLHFATLFDGLIDFNGALLPPMANAITLEGWLRQKKVEWADVESYFHSMVEGMPGRIVSIEYITGNDRIWAYHIADAAFMKAWLKHPDFHMIK